MILPRCMKQVAQAVFLSKVSAARVALALVILLAPLLCVAYCDLTHRAKTPRRTCDSLLSPERPDWRAPLDEWQQAFRSVTECAPASAAILGATMRVLTSPPASADVTRPMNPGPPKPPPRFDVMPRLFA